MNPKKLVQKIRGKISRTDYIVGSDLLAKLPKMKIIPDDSQGIILVADKGVLELYGQKLTDSLKRLKKKLVIVSVLSGEKYKTFQEANKIIDRLLIAGVNRKFLLITFGGGVTGDLGGFIASILFRGIPYIHIPTTLLAQIDASIGGKTGVDFVTSQNILYKNMVGTFTQPKAVVCDIDVLKSLPEFEIKNGLGEMVKYYFGWESPSLEKIKKTAINIGSRETVAGVVFECLKMKLRIVEKDPFDELGEREKLNFGHTIGHGIESAGHGSLSHGQAVAIGIHAAALISQSLGILNQKSYLKIKNRIKILGLPLYAKNLKREKIQDALKLDKKCGTFVLIKGIGSLITGVSVENKIINDVLEEIIIN